MKKMLLMAVALVFTLSAYASDLNKKINVSSFNELEISSFFDVTVVKGGRETLNITIDEELEPYLIARVSGNVLHLGLDRQRMPERLRRNSSERTLTAQVTMSSLTKLEVSGAAKFTCDDSFKVDEFEGEFSGASTIRSLIIDASEADFDISGAVTADITLDKGRKADFEISGASTVRLEAYVSDLEAEISGATNLKLNGEFSNLKIDCSGASSCVLKGTTTNVEYDASGASKVDAEDMIAKVADADASGASSIECTVNERLIVELSGASSIRYHSPEEIALTIKEISRGSSLKRK